MSYVKTSTYSRITRNVFIRRDVVYGFRIVSIFYVFLVTPRRILDRYISRRFFVPFIGFRYVNSMFYFLAGA